MYKTLKYSILLFCAMFSVAIVRTQNISVSAANGQNITTFVTNELLGSGVHVSNVKFNNATGNIATAQIGTFNANGFPHLMMASGVVMTTGNVSVAAGPNNSVSQSQAISGYYSDSQMGSVASGSINGCATLDFDFVSVSPFINVNYCFGSEEYPEFVCSSFNDVFAFYITGPDPQTGQTRTWNMARIPHTVDAAHPDGIPVTINAVNVGQPGSSSGGTNCYYTFSEYYVTNNYSTGVQYDGFTQKLSASATILPCTQYHMHISICNVGDNGYDSGVFIEANSFNSPQAQIHFAPASVDTIFRSHPRRVPLTLNGSDYSYALMRLQFAGTAAVDRDYKCYIEGGDTLNPTHNYVELEGADTLFMVIKGTENAMLDMPLSVNIIMSTQLCEDYSDLKGFDTLRSILAEDDIVRLRDTVITAHEICDEVGVDVAFSRYPLTFQWIPEDDIFFPTQQYSSASISESRTYHVAARDTRGNTDTATVEVVVSHTPVSIDGVDAASPVAVWPNPTDGMLNIVADGLQSMEIFDVCGRMIASHEINNPKFEVDLSHLDAGIYTLRIITSNGPAIRKVAVR